MSTEKQNATPDAVDEAPVSQEQDSPRQRLSEQAMEQGAADSRDRVGRIADPQDRAAFRQQCGEEVSSIREDLKQASSDMEAVNKATESGAKPGTPEYDQLAMKAAQGYQTAILHAKSNMYEVNRDGTVQIDPNTGRPKSSDFANRIKDEQRLLGEEMSFLSKVKQEGRQLTPDEMKKLSLDSPNIDEALLSRAQDGLALTDLQRSVGFTQANFGLAMIRSSAGSADRTAQITEGQLMLQQAATDDPLMMGPPPDPNYMKHFQEVMAVAENPGAAGSAGSATEGAIVGSAGPAGAAAEGAYAGSTGQAGDQTGRSGEIASGQGFKIVPVGTQSGTGTETRIGTETRLEPGTGETVSAAPIGKRGADPSQAGDQTGRSGEIASGQGFKIVPDGTQPGAGTQNESGTETGLEPGTGETVSAAPNGKRGAAQSQQGSDQGTGFVPPNTVMDQVTGGVPSGTSTDRGSGRVPSGTSLEQGTGTVPSDPSMEQGTGFVPPNTVMDQVTGGVPSGTSMDQRVPSRTGTDLGAGVVPPIMTDQSAGVVQPGTTTDRSAAGLPGGRVADQTAGTISGAGDPAGGLTVVSENGKNFLSDGQNKMPTGEMAADAQNFVDPMALLAQVDQQKQSPLSPENKQIYGQAIAAADSLDRVSLSQKMQAEQSYMDNAVADPEKGPALRQTLAAMQELDVITAQQQADLTKVAPMLAQQGPGAQQLLQKLNSFQSVNDYTAFTNDVSNQAAVKQLQSLPEGAQFMSNLGGFLNNRTQQQQLDQQLSRLDPNFASAQAAMNAQQKLFHSSEDTRAHYLRSLVSDPKNNSPENVQVAQQLVTELAFINPAVTQDKEFISIAQGLNAQLQSSGQGGVEQTQVPTAIKPGNPADSGTAAVPGDQSLPQPGSPAANGADLNGQAFASLQGAYDAAQKVTPGKPLPPEADKLFTDTIAINKQVDPQSLEAMKASLKTELYSPTNITTQDGRAISLPAWTDEKEQQYLGIQQSAMDAQSKVSPAAQQALQQASSPEDFQAKLQQLSSSDPTVKAFADSQQQIGAFTQANPDVQKRDMYEQQVSQVNQLQHGTAIAESLYAVALATTGDQQSMQKAQTVMQSAMKDPELAKVFPQAGEIAAQIGVGGDNPAASRTAMQGQSTLDAKTPGFTDLQNAVTVMQGTEGSSADRLGKAGPLFDKALAEIDKTDIGKLDKDLSTIKDQMLNLEYEASTKTQTNDNPAALQQLKTQYAELEKEQAPLQERREFPAYARMQYAVALNHTAGDLYGQAVNDESKKDELTKQADGMNAKAEEVLKGIGTVDPTMGNNENVVGAIKQVREHKLIDDSAGVIGLVSLGNKSLTNTQQFGDGAFHGLVPLAAAGNIAADVTEKAMPIPGVGPVIAGMGASLSPSGVISGFSPNDVDPALAVAQARVADPAKANALVEENKKGALSSGLHTVNDLAAGTAGVAAGSAAKAAVATSVAKAVEKGAMTSGNPFVKGAGFLAYGLTGLGASGLANKGLDQAEHALLGTDTLSTSEWMSHSAASFAAGSVIKGISGKQAKIAEAGAPAGRPTIAENGTITTAGAAPKSSLLGEAGAAKTGPTIAENGTITVSTPKSSLLGETGAAKTGPTIAENGTITTAGADFAPKVSLVRPQAAPEAAAAKPFGGIEPTPGIKDAHGALTTAESPTSTVQSAVDKKFTGLANRRGEPSTADQMEAFGQGAGAARKDALPGLFNPGRYKPGSTGKYTEELGMEAGSRTNAYLNPKNLFNNIKEGAQGRYFNLTEQGHVAMNGERLGTSIADYNARRFLGKTAWRLGEGATAMGIYSGATTNPFLTNEETGKNYGLGDTFKAAGEQALWGGTASAIAGPLAPKLFNFAVMPVTKPIGFLFNKEAGAVEGKLMQGLNWGNGEVSMLKGTTAHDAALRFGIGGLGGSAIGAGTHNPLVNDKYSWGDAGKYGLEYGAIGGGSAAAVPFALKYGSDALAPVYNHTAKPAYEALGTGLNKGIRAPLGKGAEAVKNFAIRPGTMRGDIAEKAAETGHGGMNIIKPWTSVYGAPFALAEGEAASNLDTSYKWGKISDQADQIIAQQAKDETAAAADKNAAPESGVPQQNAASDAAAQQPAANPQQPAEQAPTPVPANESGPVPNPYTNGG